MFTCKSRDMINIGLLTNNYQTSDLIGRVFHPSQSFNLRQYFTASSK